MIYLDYTATTPINNDVLNTYIDVQKKFFANTTSLHKLGQESNYFYEKATNEAIQILNVKSHNFVYTSNATEANNLGILGITDNKMGKIITSKIEHPSVYEVYKNLEQKGYEVVYLDVDDKGLINIKQLEETIDKNTILVSIMWVNNIVGSIQPIEKIIKVIKRYPKARLHVDVVQGLCKIIPNFDFSEIDIFTFSAHKVYGPKGIGVLAYKKNIELGKRLFGSTSQFSVKPGTFDLALVVALCKTLKIHFPKTEEHYNYVKELNNYLRNKLMDLKNININSDISSSPYILNISIPDLNGETVIHILEKKEIYISTGSSCSSKLKKPEKTIYAMTKSKKLATSTLRISLSHLTTYEEIDKLIENLEKIKHV